jgi:Cu/Ag efflux protein CusF
MRRKLLFVAFVLSAASGTLVRAQDSASTPPSQAEGAASHTQALTVKSIDEKNHIITFQAPLAPGAAVDQEGQPIALKQLQEGDQVRAAFDTKTGTVTRIDVLQKSGAKGNAEGTPQKQ